MLDDRSKTAIAAEAEMKILPMAYQYVRDWAIAIDGGAHFGRWARALATRFATVYAFEPRADSFRTLVAETTGDWPGTVICHEAALLDQLCDVETVNPKKRITSTATYVRRGGPILAVTVDSLGLAACGLIKLDLEGAELLALKGATRTLEQFGPVLILEVGRLSLKHFGTPTEELEEFLTVRGYELVAELGENRVCVMNP